MAIFQEEDSRSVKYVMFHENYTVKLNSRHVIQITVNSIILTIFVLQLVTYKKKIMIFVVCSTMKLLRN